MNRDTSIHLHSNSKEHVEYVEERANTSSHVELHISEGVLCNQIENSPGRSPTSEEDSGGNNNKNNKMNGNGNDKKKINFIFF